MSEYNDARQQLWNLLVFFTTAVGVIYAYNLFLPAALAFFHRLRAAAEILALALALIFLRLFGDSPFNLAHLAF